MTCQQRGSLWSFLLGWLSRTSRMHQSEGSFLLLLTEACWLAEGMALKVRAVPPVHKCHVHKRRPSQLGAGEEEICLIPPIRNSLLSYRFYHTRRWGWLGTDDGVLGWSFLPFSFTASGYCIFKPVLIALNMHVFTYIYIKVLKFFLYISACRDK